MGYWLRVALAALSFFAASGLLTLMIRADNSGQVQAFAVGLVVCVVNGWLHWAARLAPNR